MPQNQKFDSWGPPLQPEVLDASSCVALVPLSQAQGTIRTLPARGNLLTEYQGLLGRHKYSIAFFLLAGLALGFLVTVPKLPVYRARTSLDIQNLNSDFMNRKTVSLTGVDDTGSSDSYVQTQIKLLQSDTLRARTEKRVLADEGLDNIPADDMLSRWKSALHLPNSEKITKAQLVHETAKNVIIKPLGTTRLVEITCDSWNAKFAADFCNTLVSEFVAQDREVRSDQAQTTSDFLARQLSDVRENLARSEKKLEAATLADDIVLHHGGDSIAGDRLDQLQAELSRAQAERIIKQSQYEMTHAVPADSLPAILDDPEYHELQGKLNDLNNQVASLMPPLTEENPKIKHLRSQIATVQAEQQAKKRTVVQRIRNEYNQAQQRESLLYRDYLTQQSKVSGEQAREAQVSMLRHEVETEQTVYQTLLTQSKQAGFASALQASTVRVVDAAQAPLIPIAPRRPVSAAIGGLLGVFLGILFAFARERTETTLREPGDVQRLLAMRELGVIPSAGKTTELNGGRSPIKTKVLALIAPNGQQAAKKSNNLDMCMWKDHSSLVAEAFRGATYSILLASKNEERAKIYVISSPNTGEGKSTVACNLGFALAQANRRVLLIDGDLRKPRLHKTFQLPNNMGFRDLLRGSLDLEETPLRAYCQPTMLPNLSIITSGRGSEEPVSLLHSRHCQETLEHLRTQFDLILIDTPPVMHMADARILGGLTDGAILVFRSRSTSRETAANARDLFANDSVRVIGTILNDFDPAKEGRTNYYHSYYAYSQKGTMAGAVAGDGEI